MTVTVGEVCRGGFVTTIGAHEPLSAAVVLMERLHCHRLPVLEGEALSGMLTAADVRAHLPRLREGLSAWAFTLKVGETPVQAAMHRPVITAHVADPLPTAAARLLDAGVGAMPVLNDAGQLVGLLTRGDVLRAELRRPLLSWGSVAQHMNRDVTTVGPGTAASVALRQLLGGGWPVLPVLDDGRLIGVVHRPDLEDEVDQRAAHQGGVPERPVRALMRPPATWVRASDPMHSVLTHMTRSDVSGLPVVTEDGQLDGIVTVTDVLATLLGRPGARVPPSGA